MTHEIKPTVVAFIRENFLLGDGQALAESASLMDARIVDSTGFLELVAFLEERFGISVGDDEMTPENLDSIVAIEAFVARKRQGAR